MLTLSRGSLLRRQLVGLAAGIVVFTLAAGASNVSAAQASARSTDVQFLNQTGCDLNRIDYGLAHGEWWAYPPESMDSYTKATWVSESNGFLTGTEGYVKFKTSDCHNPNNKRKIVQVHWANPYIGANSYDYDGTDPAFLVPHTGGGGNNALVTFYAKPNRSRTDVSAARSGPRRS